MKATFEDTLREHLEWVDATFPDETPPEQFKHLVEEIGEFQRDPVNAGEMADVLMLLFVHARNHGVDLVKAFSEKLAVNKGRTWEKTEAGFRHVK